jgi:hypothetical protein
MKIYSRWRLTFDPGGLNLVVLNFGDYLEAEIEPTLAREAEVAPLIGAIAPFLRPMGNNSHQLEFLVYRSASTDLEARTIMMDSLCAIDDLGKKPLRMQVADDAGLRTDRYWQWSDAIVRSHSVKREVEAAKPRYFLKFSITAVRCARINP